MVEILNVRTDGRKPQPTCGRGHQTTLDPKVSNNKWIFYLKLKKKKFRIYKVKHKSYLNII